MKLSTLKISTVGAALLTLATVSTPAFAEDSAATPAVAATPAAAPAASGPAIVGNIGLTSNYMFRGVSQTNNDPEVSGGFDYQHSTGLYVGIWGSNVSFEPGSLELDFYGGYRGNITPDIAYDVGYIKYYYKSDRANPSADYAEFYGSTTMYGFKLGVNYSRNYAFGTRKVIYPSLAYTYAVTPELSLAASVGISKFQTKADMASFLVTSSDPGDHYTDYKAGATYTWDGLAFTLSYIGSSLSKKDCGGSTICDKTVVFGVLKTL